jgi:hypothetical protein
MAWYGSLAASFWIPVDVVALAVAVKITASFDE